MLQLSQNMDPLSPQLISQIRPDGIFRRNQISLTYQFFGVYAKQGRS